MGLKDSLGWESLQKSGYTLYEQTSSFLTQQLHTASQWVYTGFTSAVTEVKGVTRDTINSAKEAVSPITAPVNDSLTWVGTTRKEVLQQWALSYRVNCLAALVVLAGVSAKGLRPRLRRVVFLGAPTAVFLTPELSPFNRAK